MRTETTTYSGAKMEMQTIKRFGQEFQIPAFNDENIVAIVKYIVRFMKKQGKRASAFNEETQRTEFRYRANDGCCCGIGAIVDDKYGNYGDRFTMTVSRLTEYMNDFSMFEFSGDTHQYCMELFNAIQRAHDKTMCVGSDFYRSFKEKLRTEIRSLVHNYKCYNKLA